MISIYFSFFFIHKIYSSNECLVDFWKWKCQVFEFLWIFFMLYQNKKYFSPISIFLAIEISMIAILLWSSTILIIFPMTTSRTSGIIIASVSIVSIEISIRSVVIHSYTPKIRQLLDFLMKKKKLKWFLFAGNARFNDIFEIIVNHLHWNCFRRAWCSNKKVNINNFDMKQNHQTNFSWHNLKNDIA